MADSQQFLTIPTYRAGKSGGVRAAVQTGELTIGTRRLALVTLDESLLNFNNLGQADWSTIIANNEEYAPLFSAIQNGLVRIWLGDVERGTTNFLTSADWIAENWESINNLSRAVLPTLRKAVNKDGEPTLEPSVVVIFGDSDYGKWADKHVIAIREYGYSYVNEQAVGAAYLVETELGHSFIVNATSRALLLGIES